MKIIAELGQNTQGNFRIACAMISVAAEVGCDGVKVQAYECADFLPEGHPDWAMFEGNRLSWDEIQALRVHAGLQGLLFGGTPTSLDGVQRLADMQVDFLKNGSDFLLRHDMIEAMVATGIETWVSAGMSDDSEFFFLSDDVLMMACTSSYPCPDEDANLSRLLDSRIRTSWFDGYSDHTIGSVAAVMACTLGAWMLEKHFTLDHNLPGPDHSFSADPTEMAALVRDVRRAEAMLGDGVQRVMPSEAENRDRWRVRPGEVRPL